MIVFLGIGASPRFDLDAAIGAEFSMTADHISEGTLTVKMPAANVAPQECDRIWLAQQDRSLPGHTLQTGDFDALNWERAVNLAAGSAGIPPTQSNNLLPAIFAGVNGHTLNESPQTVFHVGDVLYYPRVIFSGIVMSVEQADDVPGAGDDTTYKVFTLHLASAARVLSRVYCDMQFPEGANIQQILFGNRSNDPWYNPALGEFYGLWYIRIFPEGFSLSGDNDHVTNVTIETAANLWGLSVAEVLDSLASAAGGYWEINSNDEFSFRLNNAERKAPFPLDANAPIWNMVPTRDSYTTYSAIRVVGGTGPSTPTEAVCWTNTRDDFKTNSLEIVDSTHGQLKNPLHSYKQQFSGLDGRHCLFLPLQGTSGEWIGWDLYPVYYEGIETVPSGTQAATVTSGSATVTLVNGLVWPAMPSTPDSNYHHTIRLQYIPLIPIVIRMQDPLLTSAVRSQAGGTGKIEYVLKDDSLDTFAKAARVASDTLDAVSKRTIAVEFQTKNPGFAVGQTLDGNLPYYGILDSYQVTAVKATLDRADDNGDGVFIYDIQASTAAYRDSLKGLFYTKESVSLKLGQDFPVSDGFFALQEVGYWGNIWTRPVEPFTWTQIDALNETWAQKDAKGLNGSGLLNGSNEDFSGVGYGPISTPLGRNLLANVLVGNSLATGGELDYCHHIQLYSDDMGATIKFDTAANPGYLAEEGDRAGYYAMVQWVLTGLNGYNWTRLDVLNSNGDAIATFEISIDARPGAEYDGKSALVYIFIYERPFGVSGRANAPSTARLNRLMRVIMANETFGIANGLNAGWARGDWQAGSAASPDWYGPAAYESHALNITDIWMFNKAEGGNVWVKPLEAPVIAGDSILTEYIIPGNELGTFDAYWVSYPSLQESFFAPAIDKTADSPQGEYTLIVTKKDRVI